MHVWVNSIYVVWLANCSATFGHGRDDRALGGVRTRMRRHRYRISLLSIFFGNVQSVRNTIDKLDAWARFLHEYRIETAVIWFGRLGLRKTTTTQKFQASRCSGVTDQRTRREIPAVAEHVSTSSTSGTPTSRWGSRCVRSTLNSWVLRCVHSTYRQSSTTST